MSMFSEDDDLDVVWTKLITECNARAGWDLSRGSKPTVESVLAKLNPPKTATAQSHEKFRSVLNQTLTCVNRFGKIAAQTASVAFGPSEQCFNAISFVITAVQKYDAVFNNVAISMERISAFLENLRIFLDDDKQDLKGEKVGKMLRLSMYRVLEHFLVILSIWHSLSHKWTAKLKLAAKVTIFGEDEGAKAAMEKLETLVRDFTGAAISIIVKTVSDSAQRIITVERKVDAVGDSIEKVAGMLNRSAHDEEERKRQDDIRQAMGIEKDKRPWDQKQDEISVKRTKGTGEWLLGYDRGACSIPRWLDPKAPCRNIVSIVADAGYGKSFLTSVIVRRLREKYGTDPRTCIAHYYLQRDASINSALKAIIYQLASGSTPASKEYARQARDKCAVKSDFEETAKLWDRLIGDQAKSLSATFFIVIDGIDEVEKEDNDPLTHIMERVLSPDKSALLKIRLLVTGRRHRLDAFKSLSIPSIVVAPEDDVPLNQDDILLHAQRRINEMENLQLEDPEIVKLKQEARQKLSDGVRGNYIALESKLDALENSHSTRGIKDVLARAQETRDNEIARKVEQLNKSLSEDQKVELNELLLWASTCYADLDLNQYKAILLLKTGAKVLGNLETQIRNMDNFLFTIDDEKSLRLSAGIEEFLVKEREERARAASPHSNNGATKNILDGEVDIMKRVLKTHLRNIFGDNDNETYTKFAFDDFLDSKLVNASSRVHLNSPNENHLSLAQACLALVCKPSNAADDFILLEGYAWENFAYHLYTISDSESDDAAVQEISRRLLRVLRDPTLINTWWSKTRVCDWSIRYEWVETPIYAEAVSRWLKYPAAQEILQDTPANQTWMSELTGNDAPAVMILTDVAKQLARRWFALEEGAWDGCFAFVHGYLSNMHGSEVPDPPSIEDIVAVEKWTKQHLEIDENSAQWNACLAETLRRHCHWKEAIWSYQQALTGEQQSWWLKFGLAKSFRADGKSEQAIENLVQLMDAHQQRLEFATSDEYLAKYWGELLPELAATYLDSKKPTEAEKIYKMLVEESIRRKDFTQWAMEAVTDLSQVYIQKERHHEVVGLLGNLANQDDEEVGNWLCLLLHQYASEDEIHDNIHTAARCADCLDFIFEVYQLAIETARRATPKYGIFMSLRSQLASLLWSTQLMENRQVALQLWEANIEDAPAEVINEGAPDIQWAQFSALSKLTSTLLEVVYLSDAKQKSFLGFTGLVEKVLQISSATDSEGWLPEHQDLQLARLFHLDGNDDRARNLARKRLIELFDDVMKDDMYFTTSWWPRFVACVLATMDDDINAVAAWCLTRPDKDVEHAKVLDADVSGESIPLEDEPQAQAGAADDDSEDVSKLDVPGSVSISTRDHPEDDALTSIKNSALKGPLGCICDGRCGTKWSYADDMWVCKDCADVQFDQRCYDKLKDKTLDRKVCSPLHQHFYIPPFDRERWEKTPDTHMWVADKMISKMDWVEGIRREWKIDKDTLLAVKAIENSKVADRILSRSQTLPVM